MELYGKKHLIIGVAAAALGATVLIGLGGLGYALLIAPAGQTQPALARVPGTTDQADPTYNFSENRPDPADLKAIASSADYSEDEKQNILVYEKANEAVVNISTEELAYDWYMEAVPVEGGTGSGSVIDTKGYILTNNHVISGAYKVWVTLSDGSRLEGKVVGADSESDLAVVKIDPPKGRTLVTIPFGDSAGLKVGQKLLAIGNPFGFDRTLTRGIVSSLGRTVKRDDGIIMQNLIQTDASINPGNSGGPLLDARGNMIGINTMIYSPTSSSVGIGFAIPVASAKRVVAELMATGKVARGWIDVTPVQLTDSIAAAIGAPVKKGLLVSQADPGGAADRAGIRGGTEAARYGRSVIYLGGDIIVKVDGAAVATVGDLYSALEDRKPGDKVAVEFYRGSTKMSATATLSERAK